MLSVPSFPSGDVSQYALHQGYVDDINGTVAVNISSYFIVGLNLVLNQFALENGNVSRIKYTVLVHIAANELSGDHKRFSGNFFSTVRISKELVAVLASIVSLHAEREPREQRSGYG